MTRISANFHEFIFLTANYTEYAKKGQEGRKRQKEYINGLKHFFPRGPGSFQKRAPQMIWGAMKCFWATNAMAPRRRGQASGSVGVMRVVAWVKERCLMT